MSEPDDKLERAYRGLAREEPPASLDEAILAASRRAVAKPSFTRRWGVPVSLAAILVLAIGVTLEIQHEQPGVEVAPSAPTSAPAPASAPEMKKRTEPFAPPPEAAAPATAPSTPSTQAAGANLGNVPAAPPAKLEAPQAASVAPPPAQGRMLAAPGPQAAKRAAGAEALHDSSVALSDPRAELERIAKLRAEGRGDEADRALEEFRRRHPGYRIDEAMWERVKPE